MPVYNAGTYISESIESVLNQTFTDFEFLIVDDGSTDNGVEIIRSYSDPRIRLVLNEKNMGISATLNRGIELATCDLIARMDADDVCYPERLQKQLAHFEKDPSCALLASFVTLIENDGTIIRNTSHKSEYYYFSCIFNCWIYHPSVMFRKTAVQNVGMYSKTYSEDFNLWSKMMRKYRFHIIPEPLVQYRSSETSLCVVTKKAEYYKADLEQIIENVHHHTGKDFPLSVAEAQMLRNQPEDPVLTDNKAIVTLFKKLDFIADCVIRRNNVNKVSDAAIKGAALNKKKQIVLKLLKTKAKKDVAALLIKSADYNLLYDLIAKKFLHSFSKLAPQKKRVTRAA